VFENIGQFVVKHRKGVFIGYLISVLVAGVIGAGMFGSLKSQGYDDLGSDGILAKKVSRVLMAMPA